MFNFLKSKTCLPNILLGVVALIPILFLPASFGGVFSFKIFAVFFVSMVFFIGLIVHKIKQDSFYCSKNILFISFGFVIFSAILATIFSNNTFISLFGRQITDNSLLGFFVLIAFSYVIHSFFSDEQSKIKLIVTMYISGVFLLILHVLFILFDFLPSLGFFITNTTNTVGTWTDLGFYGLFMALSSIFVLQFFGSLSLYKKIGWTGLILSSIVLIFVNSQMIFLIAILFSLIFIILNIINNRRQNTEKNISHSALFVFVLSIIFLLIGNKTGVLTNSFFNLQVIDPKPTLNQTLSIVPQIIQNESVQNKIFGIGLDRFDTAWLLYRPLDVNLTGYWDTDFKYGFSKIASYMVTEGVFGALAWLFVVATLIYFSIKLILRTNKKKNKEFTYTYSAFMILFFVSMYLVHNPSFVLIMYAFIFIGMFISNLEHSDSIEYTEIEIHKSPRISFTYILTLIILMVASLYATYIFTSQYISRVIFEQGSIQYQQSGDVAELKNSIQKARFVFDSDLYTRGLVETGMLEMNSLLMGAEQNNQQVKDTFIALLREVIAYAQISVAYDDVSYINNRVFIDIYKNLIPIGIDEAKDEALKWIEITKKITPQNPTLALEKAHVHALSKEYDLAIEEIKKAIKLKSNYIDAVFLLSQIQVEKGEIDQAIESIRAGIQVDQYNPNLRFQLGLLYYNQEKFSEAGTSFENAIALSPNFANAKYFLGLSYYKNNRISDAISVFENLSIQIPDNQEIKLILNNLKSGQEPLRGAQPPLDQEPENRENLPLEDTIETSSANE